MGLGDFLKGAGKTVGEAVTPGKALQEAFASKMVQKALPAIGEAAFSNPIGIASEKLTGRDYSPTGLISNKLFGRNVVSGAGRELGASVANLGATVGYLSNPHNFDDTARGAKAAAQAVKENPGVIKDVGKEIIKSETTPEAIIGNLALFAATAGIGTAASVGAKTAEASAAGIKGAEAASAVAKGAETVSAASKASKASRVAKILGTNETTLSKVMNPVSTATQGVRTKAAETILKGGSAETPSLLRQAVAAQVQQGGKSTLQPALEGIGPEVRRGQELTAQARGASKRVNQAKAAPEVLKATADPVGYAEKKATEAVFGKGGGGGGGGPTYTTHPGGAAVIPGEASTSPGVSANGVVQPDTWPTNGRQSTFQKVVQRKGIPGKSGGAAGRMHAWEGANREGLGGIDVDYDWRRFQKRPMQPWGPIGQGKKKGTENDGVSALYAPPGAEPQQEEGAGVPRKPIEPDQTLSAQAEMPKSSLYSGIPEPTAGPRIMPAAGSSQRGEQTGRSESYKSGSVYGEATDVTMGGTLAWNAKGQGSFAFPELTQPSTVQPKQATEVGTIKPVNPISPSKPLQPLRPMGQPLVNRKIKPRQVLGV